MVKFVVKKRAQDVRDEDIADELIRKAIGVPEDGPGRDRINENEMSKIRSKLRDISFKGKTIMEYPEQDMKTRMGRKITFMKQGLKQMPRIADKFLPNVKEYRLTHPNAIIWLQINNSLQKSLDRLEAQIADYIPGFVIPHVKSLFNKLFEHLAVICEADNFFRSVGLIVLCTIDDVFEEKKQQRADDIYLIQKLIDEQPTHPAILMLKSKLEYLKTTTWKQEMIEHTHQENVTILANMKKIDREAGERRAKERLEREAKEKEDGKR